ncbi:cation diffusion facilitator family transporter [Anaerofustis stercorihominis]|uniref:cation diffusion facilitator family transporter n=1 Tax=Anaerofustis stercorihominis TaxID=214853 RepID=UPI00214CA399|nr:cation diffusion facilitator family transporter [Anaerofustis stercorihominis]MCR2033478.1 cation diffusion facilitator family transporter [Anaerofustis stercorihominis]
MTKTIKDQKETEDTLNVILKEEQEETTEKNNITRTNEAIKTGVIGIIGNLILFILKLGTSFLSGSIAILSEGIDNLIDCISSITAVIGFYASEVEGEKTHPYGHGRMEYISGLFISIIIMSTGILLMKKSITNLIDPVKPDIIPLLFIVSIISIIIKLGLVLYTKNKNKSIESSALNANIKNYSSDILATSATLISFIISPFTTLPVDGILGLIISIIIFYSGIPAFSENIILLIGKGANEEDEKKIESIIMKYPIFDKLKDFEVHDYGPEHKIAIIQISLKESFDNKELKDDINKIKNEIKNKFKFEPYIYVDVDEIIKIKEKTYLI